MVIYLGLAYVLLSMINPGLLNYTAVVYVANSHLSGGKTCIHVSSLWDHFYGGLIFLNFPNPWQFVAVLNFS